MVQGNKARVIAVRPGRSQFPSRGGAEAADRIGGRRGFGGRRGSDEKGIKEHLPVTEVDAERLARHADVYVQVRVEHTVEAWESGPVVPPTGHGFTGFGTKSIDRRAYRIDMSPETDHSLGFHPTSCRDA